MEVGMGAQALAVPVVGSAQFQGGQGDWRGFVFVGEISTLSCRSSSTSEMLGLAKPSETRWALFVRCTPNRTSGAGVREPSHSPCEVGKKAAVVPRLHRPTMIANCRS